MASTEGFRESRFLSSTPPEGVTSNRYARAGVMAHQRARRCSSNHWRPDTHGEKTGAGKRGPRPPATFKSSQYRKAKVCSTERLLNHDRKEAVFRLQRETVSTCVHSYAEKLALLCNSRRGAGPWPAAPRIVSALVRGRIPKSCTKPNWLCFANSPFCRKSPKPPISA